MEPDVSSSYRDPDIARAQRGVVIPELARMQAGELLPFFHVAGLVLKHILRESGVGPVTLLDIACGVGHYQDVFNYYVPGQIVYYGADYNPGMLRIAQETYPNSKFFTLDVLTMPIDGPQFDVVFSSATIAHVREWERAVENLVAVCGSWLVLHRNPVYLDGTPTSFAHRRDYGVDILVYRFAYEAIVEKVKTLGFRYIHQYRVGVDNGNEGTRAYLFEREGVSILWKK